MTSVLWFLQVVYVGGLSDRNYDDVTGSTGNRVSELTKAAAKKSPDIYNKYIILLISTRKGKNAFALASKCEKLVIL